MIKVKDGDLIRVVRTADSASSYWILKDNKLVSIVNSEKTKPLEFLETVYFCEVEDA